MNQAPVIVLENVSKWYGDVIGINQVSLQMGGGITGLLGPNGAGKSTMMKLLTGQLRPGSGRVSVLGLSPWRGKELFRSVGYCPDTDSFYDNMSALEFLTLLGRLAGFGQRESRMRAMERLERVGLAGDADRRLRGYSKGMRQRTKIAGALLHDPEVLILDEPLNGLDPLGRRDMLELFRTLGKQGRTLLVSSHILHEIEGLTDQIALIHHGRVLAEGQIEQIRALIENQPLTLRIESSHARAIGQALAAIPAVVSLEFQGTDVVVVRAEQPELVYERLQDDVVNRKYEVGGITALDENLEAVFQYLVKE